MEIPGQAVMRTLQPRILPATGSNASNIAAVAVAPDGNRYAACFGQTLVVADWSTGAEVWRHATSAATEALAFAPDGQRLACACADDSIHVFDLVGRNEAVLPTSGLGGYYSVAWSGKDALLAGGHYEPLVSVFSVGSQDPPRTLDPEIFSDEGRTAVAFSPDGATLASTAYNTVVCWAVGGAKQKKHALKEHAFFIDVAFSPDGARLAAIAETEGQMKLHVWSAEGSGRRQIELSGFSKRLAWAADSKLIAVTERNEPGLSLWNPTGLVRSEVGVEGLEVAASALAAHPARMAFIAGCEDGQVVIWEESK